VLNIQTFFVYLNSLSIETSYMQLNALIGDNLEELGIPKHTGPRYAAYTTVEARLKTFAYWPTRLKQTPRAMAQAGFFYLGDLNYSYFRYKLFDP